MRDVLAADVERVSTSATRASAPQKIEEVI
nr:MAG TPA: hypothetical protein [Caudoviricetes sp.]